MWNATVRFIEEAAYSLAVLAVVLFIYGLCALVEVL